MKKSILALCALISLSTAAEATVQYPMQMAVSEQSVVLEALKEDSSLNFYYPLSFQKHVATHNIEVQMMEITEGNKCITVFYRPIADRMGIIRRAEKVAQADMWACPEQQEWVVITSKVVIKDPIVEPQFDYKVVNLPNAKLQFSTEGVDKNLAQTILNSGFFQAHVSAVYGYEGIENCENARLVIAADPGNFLPNLPGEGEMWAVPRVLDAQCLD